VALTLQQGWDFAIPMSPHCSAIFLQHSRSADVIAAPGNTQAATGSAASINAKMETPTLAANLIRISLVLKLLRSNDLKGLTSAVLTTGSALYG